MTRSSGVIGTRAGGATQARPLLPRTLSEVAGKHRGHLWGEWLRGTLMHCDVTGFTAMSERLAGLGNEGAEIMAGVLNRFFERMLGIASAWGGDQVKFGGDAMLLLFRGKDHATRAVACGLEMQAAMKELRRVMAGGQDHTLRMRAGVHSGRFFAASAGQPRGLRHFFLVGPDVNTAAAAEPSASPGEVVVTAETAALLPPLSRVTTRRNGLSRVLGTTARPHRSRTRHGALSSSLRRYVSSLTLGALEAERISGISGEHRRVTVMFVALSGLSKMLARGEEAEALAALDHDFSAFLDILQKRGGYLSGSDVAEDYDKLIAVFGAPVSHEHPEGAALACALEFIEAAKGSALAYKIGINSGFVFAGMIGSSERREFTVIGDAVNTAARLMSAARPGEIVADAVTVAAAHDRLRAGRTRALRVKGKAEPVRAVPVLGRAPEAERVDESQRPAMVGRERELRSLTDLAQRAHGRGQWAYVWGEPGIGKSLLTTELAAAVSGEGWRMISAAAFPHTAGTAYAPWIAPLRHLLRGDGQMTTESIAAAVARHSPDHRPFAPLIADLLSVVSQGAAADSMDAATRRSRLQETIAGLLAGCAREGPSLVLFEDAHWADPSSLEVLALVAGNRAAGQFLCVTSREAGQPGALGTVVPSLGLHLGRLDEGAAMRLAAAEGAGEEGAAALIARGGGNPLFLRELARAGTGSASLPATVNDLLIARADRLPAEERSVLRIASVVGPTFEAPVVANLLADTVPRRRCDMALGVLARRGFARVVGDDEYAFGHALMHEAVYGALPFRERRRLHASVLDYYENGAVENDGGAETMLRHAEGAGDAPRTVRYATLAGDRNVAVYALEAAVERYERARSAIEESPHPADVDRSLLLERIGDCEQGLGRFDAAARTYELALEFAPEKHRPRSRLLPLKDAPARRAVLAQKIGYSVERNADYDGALPWFDRALAWLPARHPRVGAQICAARSGALYRKGSYEDAIAWGERGLRYATAARSPREIAYARNMLGNSYIALGRMGTAIRHYRQAVRVYHEIGDLSGQAKSNNNLGMAYFWEGILDGALYHYQVARRTDERIGDLADAMVARNNVAEVLLLLGRTGEAIEELQEVIGAQAPLGRLEDLLGLVHVNLSRGYLAAEDIPSARSALRTAQGQLRRIHAEGLLVEAALQRAEIRLAEGEARKAVAQSRRALRDARRLGLAVFEPACERVVGEALVAAGRDEEGLHHLKEAVALARKRGAAYEEARSAASLGRALIKCGRNAAGMRALVRGRAIYRKMKADIPATALDSWIERSAA